CCMFFFSSRRRHTIFDCDWSSDVCSSDLDGAQTPLGPFSSNGSGATGGSVPAVLTPRPSNIAQAAQNLSTLVLEKNFRSLFPMGDRKSTRLNSSHSQISYAVFCLKKKKTK